MLTSGKNISPKLSDLNPDACLEDSRIHSLSHKVSDFETKCNCIRRQLQEIESLKSMFFCENEFKVNNEDSLKLREMFLLNEISFDLINSIDLELNIIINNVPINIVIEIPIDYPEIPFSSLVRCAHLKSQQHILMNSDSSKFICKLDVDNVSVSCLVDWLRENLDKYITHTEELPTKTVINNESSYSRLWIYSHHLYSKAKKDSIKQWSKEMNLDGFFLSGKPGIICVEGFTCNTQMFWSRIRHLNWKRLVLKEQESLTLDAKNWKLEDWKKYDDFKEITFTNSPDNPDFSLFIKWLKDSQLEYIIPVLFGIDCK